MNLPLGRRTILSLATATLVAASGLGLAQDDKAKAKSRESKASPSAERASGVIIKVEPVTKGATRSPSARPTSPCLCLPGPG